MNPDVTQSSGGDDLRLDGLFLTMTSICAHECSNTLIADVQSVDLSHDILRDR